MAHGAWLQGFRADHEKAKSGALAGRELTDHLAARDELARAILGAQRLAVPAGQRPRRALRVARALRADLELGASSLRATTLDVSASGFAALLASPPRIGEEARVTLRIPGSAPLEATVRVAQVKPQPGSARVGFAFASLSDEDHERLERFVFDAVLAQMAS
jgi:hypothetical protein